MSGVLSPPNPLSLKPASTQKWLRVGILVALVLLTSLVAWRIFFGQMTTAGLGGQNLSEIDQAALIDKTGVRIVRVALTAGGGMIDLRYQVIDPDKAIIVHDDDNTLAIMDEKTGHVFEIPWMDHDHSSDLNSGVTYFTLLINSAGILQPGRTVTVIIGGERLEHVILQ